MFWVILGRAPGEREWEDVEVHNSEQAALEAIEQLELTAMPGWQFRIEEAMPCSF